jgi:hypothetical protein
MKVFDQLFIVLLFQSCFSQTLTPQTTTNQMNNEKCNSKYQPFWNGTCMPVANCLGATLTEICKDSNQVCCINDPDSTLVYNPNTLIPQDKYLKLIGDTPRNRHLYPLFLRSLDEAGITKCHQVAAYLSQLKGETSDFKFFEENSKLSSSFDFDSSIGNNAINDGTMYRGRGAILLRGKGNYKNASLSIDSSNLFLNSTVTNHY